MGRFLWYEKQFCVLCSKLFFVMVVVVVVVVWLYPSNPGNIEICGNATVSKETRMDTQDSGKEAKLE